jgi:exopolyphosphatase/guanosine-5'-triphosphate,3'-diphosphate pyrophosphatase
VAAIDVGTNTTRLLVAEATYQGRGPSRSRYREIDRRLLFTRLGEGVDAGGRLAPEAVGRTVRAIGELCAVAGELGAEAIGIGATSAARDASNRHELQEAVQQATASELVVLTGDEEARLSFAGATEELHPGRYLVCDIGGGSTELVVGQQGLDPEAATSLDVGAVRLTERCLRSDPPPPGELEAMEKAIDGALDDAETVLDRPEEAELVGLAGTSTTLAALKSRLKRYDSKRIHGTELTREEVGRLYRRLATMTLSERRDLPVMPEGRADIIVAGTAILVGVMERWSFPKVRVSEKDILDGLVLRMLRNHNKARE